MRRWIDDGVLVADPSPTFTIYRMRFTDATGADRDIVGVLGGLEVVDEGAGGVLPHERVTPKASTDRLDLTRATRANLSPVWGLSLATGLTELLTAPADPIASVTVDGVEHVVERVSDPVRIDAIAAALASDDVLIADGHHRYGISRTYRDERRAEAGGSAGPARRTRWPSSASWWPISSASRRSIGCTTASRWDDLRAALDARFERSPAGEVGPATLAAMESRGVLCLVGPDGTGEWLTPAPGAFDDLRSLDGLWLEDTLAGRRPHGHVPARRRPRRRVRPVRRRGRGDPDPSGERRRDRAHRPRRPADAAEVDVLHPEAANRSGDPLSRLSAAGPSVGERRRDDAPDVGVDAEPDVAARHLDVDGVRIGVDAGLPVDDAVVAAVDRGDRAQDPLLVPGQDPLLVLVELRSTVPSTCWCVSAPTAGYRT